MSYMIWSTKISVSQTNPGSSHKETQDPCTGTVLACFGDGRRLCVSPRLLSEGRYSPQPGSLSPSSSEQQPRTSRAKVTPLLLQMEDGWPAVLVLFSKRCVSPAALKAESLLRWRIACCAASSPCRRVREQKSLLVSSERRQPS